MQIGMVGLGRMGGNMVRRLLRGGHDCLVFDKDVATATSLETEGAVRCRSLAGLVEKLAVPRVVWLMVPAAAVEGVVAELKSHLQRGDTIVDGGNSWFIDDVRRSRELEPHGIHCVDVGTSGGIWGLERGYCLMIGGSREVTARLDLIFQTLAPGRASLPATPGFRGGTAEHGYLHCGPAGAGHFVKMVHNGIEYGLMAAYAEGLNILKHAAAGGTRHSVDAETSPLRSVEHDPYEFNLPDIAEVWRRGSVVASWLLDLTAAALAAEPDLRGFSGRVSDSGEGRWTIQAAVESSTPAPVLTAALYQRFASRGEDEFSNRLLSAMRYQFGGHIETPADRPSSDEAARSS